MATSPVMSMLHDGVPITLLCDLASLADPDSQAITSVERPATDPFGQDAVEIARLALRSVSA